MHAELAKINNFFVRLSNIKKHLFFQRQLNEFEKKIVGPHEEKPEVTVQYDGLRQLQGSNDICFIINNIFTYNVDNICLNSMDLSDKIIDALVCQINGNQKRHNKLMFSRCAINVRTMHQLAENLKKNFFLKFVSFAGCLFHLEEPDTSSRFLQPLMNLFRKCPNLQAVDFSRTSIGFYHFSTTSVSFNQVHWDVLINFLCSEKRQIFHINLQNIYSCNMALKNYKFCKLQTLALTSNIDQQLLQTLECFPNLKNLLLNGKFVASFVDAPKSTQLKNLLQNHATLESLTIETRTNDDFATILLQCLPESSCFKQLTLNFELSSVLHVILLGEYVQKSHITDLKFRLSPQLMADHLQRFMLQFMDHLAKSETIRSLEFKFLVNPRNHFSIPPYVMTPETWWLLNNTQVTSLVFDGRHLQEVEERNLILTHANRSKMFKGFIVALWPLIGCNVYVYLWIINFIEPYNVLSDATKVQDLKRIVASIQIAKLKTINDK